MEARLAPLAPAERHALVPSPVTILPAARLTADVVLVAYESRADLERYFETVEAAAERIGARIIVVDNASSDGSLDWVRERDRNRIIGVAMPENLGYAAAVNAAASVSDADCMILVNPDIEVRDVDAFESLLNHLAMHPNAGVAAPRLINRDGSPQESARIVPTLSMLLARQTPLGRTEWGRRRAERYLELPNVPEGHSNVDWTLGAAMAIRRSAFDRVGGWDDNFFLYFEDVDFCKRVRDTGREVHYVPAVSLVHDHHRRSRPENGSAVISRARRAHVRSAMRFFRKHPRAAFRRGLIERTPAAELARRAFDIAAASILLTLCAPLLALIALAIKLETPGPVLFRQRRLGKDMRPFTMLKFRSMRSDSSAAVHHDFVRRMITGVDVTPTPLDDDRAVYKPWPDHRVTRVGNVIRRLSLDELPQLWNVLKGDMTLVGFRPPIPYEVEYYPEWYYGRFAVRPGITGLWQTSGRNEKSYEEMVRLDIEYAERRSWKLDLMLLVKTVRVVFARQGAY